MTSVSTSIDQRLNSWLQLSKIYKDWNGKQCLFSLGHNIKLMEGAIQRDYLMQKGKKKWQVSELYLPSTNTYFDDSPHTCFLQSFSACRFTRSFIFLPTTLHQGSDCSGTLTIHILNVRLTRSSYLWEDEVMSTWWTDHEDFHSVHQITRLIAGVPIYLVRNASDQSIRTYIKNQKHIQRGNECKSCSNESLHHNHKSAKLYRDDGKDPITTVADRKATELLLPQLTKM